MLRAVAVIGSSSASPDQEEYEVAYQVGRFLAKRGFVVVCGGRGGVMEAVCKGAKQEGGLTVGILTTYTGEDANPYVDVKINTGMSWNRNPIVVASGELVVAIGGHWGTLSEIAYALILNKKIVGYKTHRIEGVENTESLDELLERLELLLVNL